MIDFNFSDQKKLLSQCETLSQNIEIDEDDRYRMIISFIDDVVCDLKDVQIELFKAKDDLVMHSLPNFD